MENNIYKKIAEIQHEIGTLKKDKQNPYFKSKYLDINSLLETLQPELQKRSLVLLQPLGGSLDYTTINTIIRDLETEEVIDTYTPLPRNDDPQKMGSIITYFRRYALVSLLALPAEDDDANSVSYEAVGTAPLSTSTQPKSRL